VLGMPAGAAQIDLPQVRASNEAGGVRWRTDHGQDPDEHPRED
jgi:hypothetical protein